MGKINPVKLMIGFAAFLAMSLMGLVTLFQGGGTGVAGMLVGLILATLPVPLYVLLALWIDRNEKEPLWMLFMAFFWGATGACLISLNFNTFNSWMASLVFGADAASLIGTILSAPLVEELAKGFILFLFFFWKKDEFDNITDGIIYATMVGLGFAMTENVLYYGRAMAEGGFGTSLEVFAKRGMMSPFAHPLFTSMTGLGLGIARETKNRALAFAAPVVGLGLAMFLHFLWNGSGFFGWMAGINPMTGFYGAYLFIMVPAFLFMIGLVLFSLARERKVIRANLTPYVQTGVISDAELETLCRMGGRFRALAAAMKSGGLAAVRQEEQFQQAASELAFHAWRTSRGISRGQEADAARESEYVEFIRSVRGQTALA